MPGQINNIDVLAGLNQVIQAINDLTVSSNSIAQSTAKQSVQLCCAGLSGTETPPESSVEGDPPPAGYEPVGYSPGSPEYNTRKCNVANMLVLNLTDVIDQFIAQNLTSVLPMSLGLGATIVAAILAFVGGTMLTVVGVLGVVASIVTLFVSGGLQLSSLATVLVNRRQDLVCSLYQSTGSDTALDGFYTILTAEGINAATQGLVNAILNVVALNLLYHKYIEGDGAVVEAQIAAYNDPRMVSCTPCVAGCGNWLLDFGTLVAGSLAEGTPGFTIRSLWTSGGFGNRQQTQITGPANCCMSITHSVSGHVPIVECYTIPGVPMCYVYYPCGAADWSYNQVYVAETICIEPGRTLWVMGHESYQFDWIIQVNGQC